MFFDLAKVTEMFGVARKSGLSDGTIDFDLRSSGYLLHSADSAYRRCDDVYLKVSRLFKDDSGSIQGLESFRAAYAVIQPRAVVSQEFDDRPVFVFLNNVLRIRSVSYSYQAANAIAKHRVGIIWIPVRFISVELGIDWASLHGFIVHANCVKRSVVAYTGLAEEFDDEELTVVVDEEDWEEGDFDEIEDHAVDLVDILARRRKKVERRRPVALDEDDEDESSVPRLTLVCDRILFSDESGDSADIFGGDERLYETARVVKPRDASDSAMAEFDLRSLVDNLDNTVHQDGIPIPVEGWSVAPVGACRTRCNLTGSARFDLNVSRNAINEAPELLRLWTEGSR
jgi:hypothetical protein